MRAMLACAALACAAALLLAAGAQNHAKAQSHAEAQNQARAQAAQVQAQAQPPRNLPEEKCARYRAAWQDALSRWGTEGLSRTFLDRHEAFIAGGCTGAHDVCPRSPREIELANILTVRSMNAGMASTFVPFACRD
jgi:hypothetical protein